MKDVQNSADTRGIAIQRVGIRDVHIPFQIKTKEGAYQQVLANISFTISLPMEYKGTHMSRFQEILNKWTSSPIAEPEMAEILQEAMERLQAEAADIRIEFKYFVERVAPVSRGRSVLDVVPFVPAARKYRSMVPTISGASWMFRFGLMTARNAFLSRIWYC